MMATYIETAREALKLSRKGKEVAEIKVALGERYSKDVHHMINAARSEEEQAEPRLTPDELTLILSVARAERADVVRGQLCSPKLKYCGGMFWAKGKPERIARKRLGAHRKGEDETKRGTGLALLDPYGGGYVRLTRAGWALVHAVEAAQ